MTAYHWVAPEQFDALASGRPDPALVASLRRARLSRVLLLLREIAVAHPEYDDLVRLLSAAQDADRAAVSTVLSYPWVGVWAARCVRAGRGADAAHLRNVVAAAALRAGLRDAAQDLVRGRPGPLPLPTLGVLASSTAGGWAGRLRTVRLGDWVLAVDDLDPYRDCHDRPAAPRLDDAGWRAWRRMVRGAWDLLSGYAAARAAELAAGLRSIVPLAGDARAGLSVTNGDAFGGFGATYPASAADLAATMVHEFTHSKVNSLLDRVPLYHLPERPAYFAPWRADPRPLSGMLQGVAAFTAVAELWHAFRSVPRLERSATARFALLRAQVTRGLEQVAAAPGLTPAGARFVSGLDTAALRLQEYAVPPTADRAAHAHVGAAEERWRHAVTFPPRAG